MADPNLQYTKDEIKKNLILLENHYKNNTCPECIDKHLITIEGLAEEGSLMVDDDAKRLAFLNLADWSRRKRKQLFKVV